MSVAPDYAGVGKALGFEPPEWVNRLIRQRMKRSIDTGGKWGSDADIVNYARQLLSKVGGRKRDNEARLHRSRLD